MFFFSKENKGGEEIFLWKKGADIFGKIRGRVMENGSREGKFTRRSKICGIFSDYEKCKTF